MLKCDGIVTSIWIWSRRHSTSIISTFFLLHKSHRILSTSAFIRPYIICLLYFGAKTIWYLHLHVLCDKLITSFIDIEPLMLKCCGCQTNFILSLGGFFFSLRNFTDSQINCGISHTYSAYIKKRRLDLTLITKTIFFLFNIKQIILLIYFI